MRILIVTPIFRPVSGGCAVYFNILTKFLRQQREIERVTVLTGRWPGTSTVETEGKLTVMRLLPQHTSASSRAGWVLRDVLRVPVSFFVAYWVALLTRSDIIHVHKSRSCGGAVVAGKILGRPVIGDVRDLFDLELFKMANLFIACGRSAIEKLRGEGVPENKMELHPVPFELELEIQETVYKELSGGFLKKRKYILFVGDICDMKGIPELLEGYINFRRKRKDVDLVLVGENLMDDELNERAERAKGVHVLKPVPHPEVLGLIKHAELVVLPSKFELFPRVCMEGIMLKKKVIFPPVVPEFKEHADDFVLPEVSPGAIERMLEKALDSDKRPEYPVEQHDSKLVGKRVFSIYKKLTK